MKVLNNSPKLNSIRPLERLYLLAMQQRDQDEKMKFKAMYDEFANYNRDILKLKNKNNELQSLISLSSGGDMKTKFNVLLQTKID